MAGVVANPYYDDPWLTKATSDISKIFVDQNPGQTAVHNAQAKYYGAETDALTRKAGAQSKIGAIFTQRNGQALSPQDYATITGSGIEGGVDPKVYQQGNVFYASNTGQPDSVIARAVVGTDKPLGSNEGVSLDDRNAIAQRQEGAAMARTNAQVGGQITVANIHETGQNERADKADARSLVPVFVTDDAGNRTVGADGQPAVRMVPKSDFGKSGGNNPVLPNSYYEKGQDTKTGKPAFGLPGAGSVAPFEPQDRFVQTPGADGKPLWQRVTAGLPAMPPKESADHFVQTPGPDGKPIWKHVTEGLPAVPPKTSADHFVPTPDANSPTGFSLAPAGPGVPVTPPGAASRPPMAVNANELAQIEQDALAGIGVADPTNKFAVDPQFSSSEYAAKIPAARAAAADTFQKTRNAAQAQAAYVQALGVQPTAKWVSPGAVSRVFGGTAQFNIPGNPGPTVAPPAAAGPAAMAVPAAPQRVVGKSYPTPRGPMTWTAEGWVPTPHMDNGTR